MQKEWRDSWSASRCHFDVLRIIKARRKALNGAQRLNDWNGSLLRVLRAQPSPSVCCLPFHWSADWPLIITVVMKTYGTRTIKSYSQGQISVPAEV
jgi:hypothetical protein